MKQSDIRAIVDYMYKDEMQSYEEFLLDRELFPEAELVDERIPIANLAEHARQNPDIGHIFTSVQALADFLDEE